MDYNFEKLKFSKFLNWDENTLSVVTSWPLSGHLVAFFSLKLLTGHKTFSETIKSIQNEFPVQKFTKKYQKFTIFFICWSKVFTIETALLFLEIFHKLWRHDRWTWYSLNTRYFGSFLKSKFYLLKLFWTLNNAATSFWSFELKEFKKLLFLGCWNEIWWNILGPGRGMEHTKDRPQSPDLEYITLSNIEKCVKGMIVKYFV